MCKKEIKVLASAWKEEENNQTKLKRLVASVV